MANPTIDELTLSILQQEVSGELRKALPPKIAYRLRAWFKRQGRRVNLMDHRQVAAQVAQKMEEAIALKELKKNQVMARVQQDGVVKLDFGSAVPEKVREAAMSWAKRRGLTPVEASLNKGKNSPYSITYVSDRSVPPCADLVAQYVWEIPQQ